MTVLVTYASRYGSTAEIAERIAVTLIEEGVDARAQQITQVRDLAGIDAFVIGSAVYFGSWLKPATTFVERNREVLAGKPVWLFSSGPLPGAVVPDKAAGTSGDADGSGDASPADGAQQGVSPAADDAQQGVSPAADESEPKGVEELAASIGARRHRVFDGALDPHKLGLRDRMIRALPAGKNLLPEVDGRDWTTIEAWALEIATALKRGA